MRYARAVGFRFPESELRERKDADRRRRLNPPSPTTSETWSQAEGAWKLFPNRQGVALARRNLVAPSLRSARSAY